jgi:hypothetical protein
MASLSLRSLLPLSSRRSLLPLSSGKSLAVLAAAVILLLIPVVLIEVPVLEHTHGSVLFPQDKAFVDFTVARNLAFFRVWGLSKYAFQSASSSLLYPLVLAPVFFIFGAQLVVPLAMNFVAATGFLFVLQRALIRVGVGPLRQLMILVAAMGLTVLPLLVVSGLEYTLELLCVVLFMERVIFNNITRSVYIYGLLAVAARYEDLLIVALACVLVGLLKGRKAAVKLALIAVSPVLVFGVMSLLKGSYFFPNSLLLGPNPGYALALALAAIALVLLALWRYSRQSPAERLRTAPRLALLSLGLLALPFGARNLVGLGHFRRDCDRIYDQQYLTARFVHRYYFKWGIGINDPGVVSWFSEGRKLDFTGVGSSDVTRCKKEHRWSPGWADSLSRKMGISTAIVSDPWFRPDQLPMWNKVASWRVPDGGGDAHAEPGAGEVVFFYAINKYDTARLRKSLHDYQPFLPAGVAVQYYY